MIGRMATLIIVLHCVFVPVETFGQPPHQPLRQKPENSSDAPWNRDLLVYRVGKRQPAKQIGIIERAGVPTLARMVDGRLIATFQYFPKVSEKGNEKRFDRIAASFSSDEGNTWSSPETIVVEKLPRGMVRPFDPTLVTLPDGRVRMYFTGNYSGRFEESTPTICSAISEDGLNYVFEDGVRFAIENKICIDCAVALHGNTFHLFVPDNSSMEAELNRGRETGQKERPRTRPKDANRNGYAFYATSKDGLSFERHDDLRLDSRMKWLGNATTREGELFFFGTGSPVSIRSRNRASVPSIWFSSSRDGRKWKSPNVIAEVSGGDPAVVQVKGGDWLVIATSVPVRNEPLPHREPPLRGLRKP
jgi:hypothetical protein